MKQSSLSITHPGKPPIRLQFSAAQHHRYQHIPVVRMEHSEESRLAGYGQFTTTGEKSIHILFHGDTDKQTQDATETAIRDEISRLLDAWPEMKAGIIRMNVSKGHHIAKGDLKFLATWIRGAVGVFDFYGTFYPLKPADWESAYPK